MWNQQNALVRPEKCRSYPGTDSAGPAKAVACRRNQEVDDGRLSGSGSMAADEQAE